MNIMIDDDISTINVYYLIIAGDFLLLLFVDEIEMTTESFLAVYILCVAHLR